MASRGVEESIDPPYWLLLGSLFSFISVMSLKTLKLEEIDDGKILRITIDRPQRLNAMNEDFFNEIRDTFRQVNSQPKVRVVILQAAGKLFSAGLDLK